MKQSFDYDHQDLLWSLRLSKIIAIDYDHCDWVRSLRLIMIIDHCDWSWLLQLIMITAIDHWSLRFAGTFLTKSLRSFVSFENAEWKLGSVLQRLIIQNLQFFILISCSRSCFSCTVFFHHIVIVSVISQYGEKIPDTYVYHIVGYLGNCETYTLRNDRWERNRSSIIHINTSANGNICSYLNLVIIYIMYVCIIINLPHENNIILFTYIITIFTACTDSN